MRLSPTTTPIGGKSTETWNPRRGKRKPSKNSTGWGQAAGLGVHAEQHDGVGILVGGEEVAAGGFARPAEHTTRVTHLLLVCGVVIHDVASPYVFQLVADVA
jgi:hypothetical protein